MRERDVGGCARAWPRRWTCSSRSRATGCFPAATRSPACAACSRPRTTAISPPSPAGSCAPCRATPIAGARSRCAPARRRPRPRARSRPPSSAGEECGAWPALFRGPGRRHHGPAAGGGAQAGHAPGASPGRPVPLRAARGAERRGRADRRPHQLQHPDRRHPLQLPLSQRAPDPDAAARAVRRRSGGVRGGLARRPRHPAVRGDRPAAARAVRLHRHRRLDRGDGRADAAQLPARVLPAGGLPRAAPQHPARRQRPLPDAVLHRAEGVQPPADRRLPRHADQPRQVDHQVPLDPGHGPVLRDEHLPGRDLGDLGRPRFAARADRPDQEGAGAGRARLRRAAHLLRHQRHLDRQQDRAAGAGRAGRHPPGRPRLPQVAPLRAGARRARTSSISTAIRCTPTRCTVPCRCARSRSGCCEFREAGKLDRVKALLLTNCTFDGIVYNVAPGDGGMPRDQAGPRLLLGRGLVRLRPLRRHLPPAHRHGDRGRAAAEVPQREVSRGICRVPQELRRRATTTPGWSSGCCPTRTRCASGSTSPTRPTRP